MDHPVSAVSALAARRRAWVLAAVCMAAVALPLSFSGGAVATPAIGRDLHGSPVAMNWITNAFMLAFGSFLMASGALADQFGRKRLFAIGVGGFTLMSVALAFAPSMLAVDLLRAAQGLAAAAALAGGTAALAQEFDGAARTRAFSLLGTTFGIGLAFGPVLAGGLIGHYGWRAIFVTSAVAGVLSLAFGLPRMDESRDPHATGLDWPGTAAFTTALTLFTFGVIEAPARGWSSPLVIALLAGAALGACAFVTIETRVARPMLDLSLFRIARFVGVQVLPVSTCCCYIVLLVVLPLRFIGIDGFSEIDAGWLMLAISAPMLVVPLVAATLTRWLSAGVISGLGLLVAAAGLVWLGIALRGGAGSAAIAPMLAIGVGAGMPWGADGRAVGERRAEGARGDGDGHFQHDARGRRGDRAGDRRRGTGRARARGARARGRGGWCCRCAGCDAAGRRAARDRRSRGRGGRVAGRRSGGVDRELHARVRPAADGAGRRHRAVRGGGVRVSRPAAGRR